MQDDDYEDLTSLMSEAEEQTPVYNVSPELALLIARGNDLLSRLRPRPSSTGVPPWPAAGVVAWDTATWHPSAP